MGEIRFAPSPTRNAGYTRLGVIQWEQVHKVEKRVLLKDPKRRKDVQVHSSINQPLLPQLTII